MKETYHIIILDTEMVKHTTHVEIEPQVDGIDTQGAITDAAIVHCSDNGYEYETWDFAE